MKTPSFVAPFFLLAACGGGGSKPKVIVDAPTQQIDAPTQPACSAEATLTTAMNFSYDYTDDRSPDAGPDGIPGNADDGTPGQQEYWASIGDLNADPLVDWLWIELYEGPPPNFTIANFPATPFTIQLVGGELDYTLCSMCITLTTDVDLDMSMQQQSLVYKDDYMAVAGSVEITELTATKITGTLQNVIFNHVDISMDGTVPNPSGCKSDGPASLPFTAMPMAFENGKTKYGIKLPFVNPRRPARTR